MRSVHVRLILLQVVIVTAVLAVSGAYSHYGLERELESRHEELRNGVLTRLANNLPSVVWNLDTAGIGGVLEGEMQSKEVLAIRVFASSGDLIAGRMRMPFGPIVSVGIDTPVEGDPVDTELVYRSASESTAIRESALGRAVVNFSREQIDASLRAQALHKLAEIVLLDLILLAALSFSLRIVFTPLGQLRDGLTDLATRDSSDVDELPEGRNDEFGELVRGFNRLLRKSKSIIARARHAEEEARRASTETAKAYEELRMAQDSLLEAERLASLGGLVAGVAHEINTPVGITLTSASVLKDATGKALHDMAGGTMRKSELQSYLDTADECARLILANADRAAHLIQSFKQIAVDRTDEARRAFALREYIDEIVTSLRPRLKQTRVKVEIDCASEIKVDAYPGAFAQIVTNLLMNALMHAFDADEEGAIHIQANQDGDWIELRFTDNGKGIALDNLGKIFDPFFTTRRGQGGTGLGLNIVYNLVTRRLGGTINVASQPGQGTGFTIRFPSIAPELEPA